MTVTIGGYNIVFNELGGVGGKSAFISFPMTVLLCIVTCFDE